MAGLPDAEGRSRHCLAPITLILRIYLDLVDFSRATPVSDLALRSGDFPSAAAGIHKFKC